VQEQRLGNQAPAGRINASPRLLIGCCESFASNGFAFPPALFHSPLPIRTGSSQTKPAALLLRAKSECRYLNTAPVAKPRRWAECLAGAGSRGLCRFKACDTFPSRDVLK